MRRFFDWEILHLDCSRNKTSQIFGNFDIFASPFGFFGIIKDSGGWSTYREKKLFAVSHILEPLFYSFLEKWLQIKCSIWQCIVCVWYFLLMRSLIWNRICTAKLDEGDVIYPIPKKCSQGSPCTPYFDLDYYKDHPDCGESEYGTSECDLDGYKSIFFSYFSHYNIQTLIIFKGQLKANILWSSLKYIKINM